MPNMVPRMLRLNTSITIPQMSALEGLAKKEGRHKAEIVRNALELYFETKGIKVQGKARYTALLRQARIEKKTQRNR